MLCSYYMKKAFSLVELSIVLVILGLLTGGILAGQSLIRAAELRSITSDINKYQAATLTFRDKYFALPGDMLNATRFWGVQAGTGSDATCVAAASTTQATCNGNGDGIVNGGGVWGQPIRFEIYRFWQHLANAGLVEGSFSGVPISGNLGSLPGTNVPASKISTAGFDTHDVYTDGTGPWWQNNSMAFLIGTPLPNDITLGPAIRPEEAWNIDTKADDGKPAYGNIKSIRSGYSNSCNTTTVASTAEYALTSTSIACALFFNFSAR